MPRNTHPMSELPDPVPPIAYFDLDGTLMDGYSAVLAGLYLLRRGRLGLPPVFLSLVHMARYHLRITNYDQILRDGLAPWIGRRRDELQDVSRECFDRVVHDRLYRDGIELVGRYRAAGSRVALISSTSPFILEEVRRHLGCADALATDFAFEDDLLTDRMLGPAVFAEGKVEKAAAHAHSHGVELRECAFHTDNASDLPLLEAVGHSVAVNPDRKLRRHAVRRRWPVLTFSQTLGNSPPRP